MKIDPHTSNPLLTVEQVASRYGVSVDTIWRWKREGLIPKAVKLGANTTRWRLTDLEGHELTLQAQCVVDLEFCSDGVCRPRR